jgi:Fe(3+) dicitrate transport protein
MAAGGGDGSGDMFNGGQATVAGLEFFASYDPLMRRDLGIRLPIAVGYTFTDARFGSSFQSTFEGWGAVVEGDQIPFIAEHQVNVRITLEGSRGNVSLNLNHMGAMASSAGPGMGDAQEQIPAFTVLDLSGTYRLSKQMEVFGTVQNLADEVYMVSLVPAGARPGLPRTVQAGVRFRL